MGYFNVFARGSARNSLLLLGLSLGACDLRTQVSNAFDAAEASLKTNQNVQVISMSPAINGRDVDPTTHTILVNMIMPSAPITGDISGLVRVRSPSAYLKLDQVVVGDNGTSLLITLGEPLAAKTLYRVMISNKLLDAGKHHLKANFSGAFVTGLALAPGAPAPVVANPDAAATITPPPAGPDACLNIIAPNDDDPNTAPFSSTDCANSALLQKVFVHPTGSDSNPGTFAAPVQSLAVARDRAAAMTANGQGVAIMLRGDCAGGCNYTVLDPVLFEPMAAPVLIKSVLGPVHLSGGIDFGEGQGGTWSDATISVVSGGDDGVSGKSQVMKFTFDDSVRQAVQARRALGANNGKFLVTQLFHGGDRLRRSTLTDSRFNLVHVGITGTSRKFVGVTSLLHPENVDIGSQRTELLYDWKWQHARGQIQSWILAKNKATMTVNIDQNAPLFKQNSNGANARGLIENNLAFVDTPGEWYLDEDSVPMAMYYKPRVGENVRAAGVYTMPINQQIIKVRGRSKTDAVHGIYIDGSEGGLMVEYTNWKYQGFTSDRSYGGLQQALPPDGAIDANFVDGMAIKNVTFQHFGSHGVRLGGARNYMDVDSYNNSFAQNTTVFNNVFFDGGGSAVVVDSFGNLASNSRIKSNRLQDLGKVFADATGITVENSSRSWTAFNQIVGTAYTGIAVGDRCPVSLDDRQDVYSNTIDDTMRVLDDGGGIYLHTGYGIVKNNKISGTAKNAMFNTYQRHALWDLYFDEVAFFWRAQGNTIPRTFLVKSHSITYSGNIGVTSPKYLDSATGSDALSQCPAAFRHAPTWW